MKKILTDFEKYDVNPFIGMGKLEIVRKHDYYGTDSVVLQQGTGELQGVGLLARHRRVDNEKFVKLFTDKISDWLALTKNAQRMLCYFIGEMRNGNDKVTLYLDKVKELTGYKSNGPIYSGIAELIELKIVARSNYTNTYYINPYYMFNGDRLVFMESIEKMDITPVTDQGDQKILQRNAVLELPVNKEMPLDFES
jgi:hypothetical protein